MICIHLMCTLLQSGGYFSGFCSTCCCRSFDFLRSPAIKTWFGGSWCFWMILVLSWALGFRKKVLDPTRIWPLHFVYVFTTIWLYLLTWACLASILRPLGPVLDLVVFFRPLFEVPGYLSHILGLFRTCETIWQTTHKHKNRIWLRSQYVLFVSHLLTLTELGGSVLVCMLWQSWTQVRASHGFDLELLQIEMWDDARIIKSYTSSGSPPEDHPKTYSESSQ